MPTPIHQHACRLLWAGSYSTLEIVSELRDKFDLGESAERDLEIKVGELRAQIQEARSLAPAFAEQMFRDGVEYKEIEDRLLRPYLLSGFEIQGIISRARAVIEAEQAADAPTVEDFEEHEALLRKQAIEAAARIDPSIQENLDENRRVIEEHEKRLEAQRLETRK